MNIFFYQKLHWQISATTKHPNNLYRKHHTPPQPWPNSKQSIKLNNTPLDYHMSALWSSSTVWGVSIKLTYGALEANSMIHIFYCASWICVFWSSSSGSANPWYEHLKHHVLVQHYQEGSNCQISYFWIPSCIYELNRHFWEGHAKFYPLCFLFY